MTTLDLVLAGGLAVGVWRGLRTGALTQIAGVAGWVLGFLFASAAMRPIGEAAAAALGVSARTAPVLGFVLAFALALAAVSAAAYVLRATLKAIKLGGLDTVAGAVAGGLRAAFGLSVLLLVTGLSPFPGGRPLLIGEDTREASVLYDPVEAVAPTVWDLGRAVVPGIQEAVADRFNTWQETPAEAADDDAPDDPGGDAPPGSAAAAPR